MIDGMSRSVVESPHMQPSLQAPKESDRESVANTLLSMFGPRWTRLEVERLVEDKKNNLDICIQEILRHEATGKPPMDWEPSDNSSQISVRSHNSSRNPMNGSSDASTSQNGESRPRNKLGAKHIDPEVRNYLLTQRVELIETSQEKSVSLGCPDQVDLKPSATNEELINPDSFGAYHSFDQKPPISSNTARGSCSSPSSLSTSSRSPPTDSPNNQNNPPAVTSNLSNNAGINRTKPSNPRMQHNLTRQKATLSRFLDTLNNSKPPDTTSANSNIILNSREPACFEPTAVHQMQSFSETNLSGNHLLGNNFSGNNLSGSNVENFSSQSSSVLPPTLQHMQSLSRNNLSENNVENLTSRNDLSVNNVENLTSQSISLEPTTLQHMQSLSGRVKVKDDEEDTRDMILATLEIERNRQQTTLNQIDAYSRELRNNSAPPQHINQNSFSQRSYQRAVSDGRLLSSSVKQTPLNNPINSNETARQSQTLLGIQQTVHNRMVTDFATSPHQRNFHRENICLQLANDNSENQGNSFYEKAKELGNKQKADKDEDELNRAIQASLEFNRDEINEERQLKMALAASLQETRGLSNGFSGNNLPIDPHDNLVSQISRDDVLPNSSASSCHTATNSTRHLSTGDATKPTLFQRYTTESYSTQDFTVFVKGAGIRSINGKYHKVGTCNGVGMFRKSGTWEGSQVNFTLYRCQLNNGERKWFISIVPDDIKPGTDEDRDFYGAPGTSDPMKMRNEHPPEDGWTVLVPFGRPGVPYCFFFGRGSVDNSFVGTGTIKMPKSEVVISNGEVGSILVSDAGFEAINGIFVRKGNNDGVSMYMKESLWEGRMVTVLIYRKSLDKISKRWLITLIPETCAYSASNLNIDLYYVQIPLGSFNDCDFPPRLGWKCTGGFGIEPTPTCSLVPQGMNQVPSQGIFPSTLSGVSSLNDNVNDFVGDIPNGQSRRNFKKDAQNTACIFIDQENRPRTGHIAMCVICKVNPVTHVLIPCGHPCLCENCSAPNQFQRMEWTCPVANCPVNAVMRFLGTLIERDE